MSKALIALTALLGLFSFHSYAAPDDGSSCREKAEDSETASVRFIGASSCSIVGSVFTGNDHCQVKAKSSSTCAQDQHGVWVGYNYYFTGCLAGVECGNQPDPEDPDPEEPEPTNPIYGQLNTIDPIHVATYCNPTDPTWTTCTQVGDAVVNGFYFTSDRLAKLSQNDNVINTNVETLSQRMARFITSVTSAEVASRDAKIAADIASANSIATATSMVQLKQQAVDDKVAMDESFTDLNENLEEKFTENKELHEKTHEAQDLAQTSLDSITSKLPLLDVINTRAGLASDYSSEAAYKSDLAYQRADAAAFYADDARWIASEINSTTNEIRNILLDGGGTGGGGGTDMSETNAILTDIQNDANNSAVTIDNKLIGVNDRLDGLLGQGQGLSNQLGQQLNQIKTAIENSGGGTGGGAEFDDSEILERLDTSNYELSELKQILDSRSQATNSNLVGIGNSLQTLNDATTAQGQQLSHISGTLDGIGESLNGLKDGLQGEGMSVGDFNPEGGVLDALGIDGDESVDDLTADPVTLNDYRGQFRPFLQQLPNQCPENIPVKMRILGKDYTFNLYYQPVCDFMAIAGTILNWAVWLSVPFIVFGRRSAT